MSYDLISREAAYKAFSDYLNKSVLGETSSRTELSIGEIASVIKSIPVWSYVCFDRDDRAYSSRKYGRSENNGRN